MDARLTAVAAAVIALIVGIGIGYAVWGGGQAPAQEAAVEAQEEAGQAGGQGGAGGYKYTVYYISHGGPGDPWWGPVIKGAKLAGDLLGVKVIYQGPEKFSVQWLVNALESAAAANPDGIIITITNYQALDGPLRRVIEEKGIPVIAVNVPDPRPEDERIPYLSYVGQDEYQAGYQLAKYVIKWFQENKGRPPKAAVIGIHEPGHVGLEMRAKGIQDAFREAGLTPPEKIDITTDTAKAYARFESYLQQNPDVEVIFTLGPLGAHPAMDLVADKGLKGKVYVATVDLDDKILKGIEDGVVIAAVSQQPFAQGFLPVVFMYLYLEYGIMPPSHVPTGPTIIDKGLLDLVRKQIQTTGGA